MKKKSPNETIFNHVVHRFCVTTINCLHVNQTFAVAQPDISFLKLNAVNSSFKGFKYSKEGY